MVKVSGVPYDVELKKPLGEKKNRFDLEQDILSIYSVKDDLKEYWSALMESRRSNDVDDVVNHVQSFEYVLNLKIDKLWDTFCQTYEIDEYRNINK